MISPPVNYITHLNSFVEYIKRNKSLHPNHISLYLALFHTWNQLHFPELFPVNRKAVRRKCGIGSNNTYAICLKNLNDHGLILYIRSSTIGIPSYIHITRLSTDGGLIVDNRIYSSRYDTVNTDNGSKKGITPCIKAASTTSMEMNTRTVSEQVPFIKQYSINKDKRESKQKVPAKNNVDNTPPDIPLLGDVLTYFASAGLSVSEARKFYFHYMAVGWMINGKPIRSWQSAAHKWAENIESFTPKQYNNGNTTPGSIDVNQNKRYDIPL